MTSACKWTMSLALLAGGMGSTAVAQTVINFDDLADATIVTNQYAAQGVNFTGAAILVTGVSLNPDFPAFTPPNVVFNYNGPNLRADAASGTWASVGGYITGNTIITLDAYDAGGILLASTATPGANNIGAGTGFNPNIFLSVAVPNIAYVIFHDGGDSFTLDNFTFEASSDDVTPVPLPAAAWAGMALLGSLAAARKVRQRLA